MAKVAILGQRSPNGQKMLVRGAFTQRKRLWGIIEGLVKSIDDFSILDDVNQTEQPCTYNQLCAVLRKHGRATLTKDGRREFQILDAELNALREWDVDENGNSASNPIQ